MSNVIEEGGFADSSDRRMAEASGEIGLSPRVLRYWERIGVVKPSRDPAGRRHFSRHDLLLMALIREVVGDSHTSISDLRLVRELAEREVVAAMADPLTRLRLLFLRQEAEPYFRELMEEFVPPPHRGSGPAGPGGGPPGPGPAGPPGGW
jgi:DNA-binding transcriptional MerR regulator